MFLLASAPDKGPVLSPGAPTLFEIGPIPITNSMLYTWVVAAVIIFVIRLGTRNLSEIPTNRWQNLLELVIDGLRNLMNSMLEPKVVRWVYPLIASYFIFILMSNLMGLLPGVGSIKYNHQPIFRPPTADANMTIALSAIFFFMSLWWALKYNGVLGLFQHIFGVKAPTKGLMYLFMSLIFFGVGLIEVVSLIIRPVALSMRLYGNIYGGESVLTVMLGIGGGLIALPFYFLEIIVAIVQAVVFTMLCIAFVGTLCSHSDSHHQEAHA
ncbi:MAG: F0F1 ATP synthase subunit A [Methylacidiphilales bacterium]|nr:F0F1 ATP synthase subunit A [Candidatus Methylacidiphilales bacterium]MDW8349595.1 F0F1 ATP synthase subunit A [Verrucomicrobiae bacterium]